MTDCYDTLETRDPAQREAALLQALPKQIAHAQQHTPAFAEILKGVNPAAITSSQALAALPVTRKYELLARQQAQRDTDVFGGFSALSFGKAMPRVFASPGTIYEPEGTRADYWRVARALFAAGFRAGELVHNCFSYHFTPAGSIMESGAHALGCSVFPGGTGQTEQQLQAMAELRPAGYCGTPSFLKIIIDKAAETGVSLPSLKKALVSGEAFPPSLCPTGRTNQRIKGWLGRADQTTKVRGMFVHPGQVDQIVKRFAQIGKARLVVSGEMAQDHMHLHIETTEDHAELIAAVEQAVRDITKLRADIVIAAPGSLPNDGKVIEDARSYK